MALIECYECNGKVSDKASACPHCGAPVQVHQESANNPAEGKTAEATQKAADIQQTTPSAVVEPPPRGAAPTPTSLVFRNPQNNHQMTVFNSESASFAFLFGGAYFLTKGIWIHFLIWLFLIGPLLTLSYFVSAAIGFVSMIIVGILYAFSAKDIVRNHYLKLGWVEVPYESNESLANPKDGSPTTQSLDNPGETNLGHLVLAIVLGLGFGGLIIWLMFSR